MNTLNYLPVKPDMVYAGLKPDLKPDAVRLIDLVNENKPSGNSYIDLFAARILKHGRHPSKEYARMFGVDTRKFDSALECMTGLSAHDWINEYLRLVACDLLANTKLSFKEIGKLINLSSSSFSQFFMAYQHMQPSEYRSLKQTGRRQKFFYD